MGLVLGVSIMIRIHPAYDLPWPPQRHLESGTQIPPHLRIELSMQHRLGDWVMSKHRLRNGASLYVSVGYFSFLIHFLNNYLHVTKMRCVAANVQRLVEHHARLLWEMVSNILVVLFSLNS